MIAPQPFFTPRGTPFSVLYRLHALSRLGHEIDLITYHIGQDIPIENVSIKRIPKIPFIRKIRIGPSKEKILLDIFVFIKTIRLLLRNRYDVIHSHEEAGFFSTWLAKIFSVKHIYDMHSSLPQQLGNFKFTTSSFLVHSFELLEKKTLKDADGVITICPALFDYVEGIFPDKNQILIENVVDNSWVLKPGNETAASLIKQYGLKDNFKILYTGTLEPYQGIDLLVESAKDVVRRDSNVSFILVGGDEKQIERYKKQVDMAGLTDRFIFTGQVWPNVIPLFVELSDILVSPRIEGNNTPLKIYSYLRSGKSIVATDHPTHTQVLDDQIAILTKADPKSFSDGIIKLLNNRELRNKISTNALKVAQDKYSFEGYLSKTKTIYETLNIKTGN
jgi:glycosyltransferase involved in cell wall biosynthesis